MNALLAALWAETLKARRSKASLLTVIGFALFPLVSGLFMMILKDPQAAQSMGLISVKAQLVAGTADWPAFFDMLLQATAMGGSHPVCLYHGLGLWTRVLRSHRQGTAGPPHPAREPSSAPSSC